MKICVIGLGEIGFDIFKEIKSRMNKKDELFGVDVNEVRINELKKEYENIGIHVPLSDVYIIVVYTTEQVLDVMSKLDYKNKPLTIIESTVNPGTYKYLKENFQKEKDFDLVLFPHRFNPNDPEHHVFNLDRIMGGNENGMKRAEEFYKQIMDFNLVHKTSPEIVELAKPIENAYRFIEIAIAEDLKMRCSKKGIDFNELRKATNSKWNIDIKEARVGIGGKCLPKDIKIIRDFFNEKSFFDYALEKDEEYKEWLKEN